MPDSGSECKESPWVHQSIAPERTHEGRAQMATATDERHDGNKYCVAKWKQRTHSTHEEHVEEFRGGGPYKALLIGSSMFERFKTTGRELVTKKSWKSKQIGIAGVGGDGVQHMLYRVENGLMSAVCEGNEGKLTTVVIMAGANNVEEKACTPEKLLGALVCLVQSTVETWVASDRSGGDKRVVLLALTPRSSSRPKKVSPHAVLEKIREYNRGIADWVHSTPVIECPSGDAVRVEFYDAFKPFMNRSGEEMNTSLFCDTVHLNERGYGIFARTVVAAIASAAT